MLAPSCVRTVAVLVILGIAACGSAAAQYQIDRWTTEQGLPQGTVVDIKQTPDGFIWVSTLGGLARFDGVSVGVFDTGTNPELPNSRLAGMRLDDDGQLWVLTQERYLMRFRDGRFLIASETDGLPAKTVGVVTLDDGRVVAETVKGTVIWKDGRFVPHTAPGPPPGAEGMTLIGESAAGARWFRDAQGMAHRYEGDRRTRTAALPLGDLREDGAGRVWMRDPRHLGQLLCIDGETVRAYGQEDGALWVDHMAMLEDPDGTLWFPRGRWRPAVPDVRGLVRFRNGRFTVLTTADGLPHNQVRVIFRDREGNHWVGTENGLARLTEQPVVNYGTADGLAALNTYPVMEDRRGDIWIGGWPGLTRFHNGTFEDVTSAYGLRNINVLALGEDREGTVWVGDGGGNVWRVTDGRLQAFPNPVVEAPVFAIYQGRGPDIWLGTGLGAVRYRDGVFEPRLPGTRAVNTFLEDAAGVLWIGSDAGLARYEGGVVTPIGQEAGFSGRRVREIYGDADGTIWIGTYDTGLFRYRDGAFTHFTTREGLPANGAFRILEDDRARFWISSNVGIYRIAKAELEEVAAGRLASVTAVRYGRADGMADQECNGLGRPAGIRARDGRFWFPTQRGVAVLDPHALASLPPPPVAIMDVLVDGQSVPLRDRIEMRETNSSISVRYSALTFVRPELARFRYRMEGVEADWVEAGTDRMARYTHLPFGSFRLRVLAANREGIWNEEGAGITVVVIPPFYRTTWFLALVLVGVAAAGYGTHRVRLGILERKRALQEAFSRQLIDSQEADRKRIASELHDGVSQTLVVIRNWAQMGGQTLPRDDAAGQRLGKIAEAASQALGEVREVVHELLPYHLERVGLADAIREAAGRVADASGIPIACNVAAVDGRLSADTALRLFRVVQEGLNNIVKHSGATAACLDMAPEHDSLRVTLRDNGRGFEPARVAPAEPGHGFGLVGMSERTRMMGGTLTVESAPARGTTITIVVPCANEVGGA